MHSKKINIRVITGFPNNPNQPFRVIEDLMMFQSPGVEISLSHNPIGPIHCQNDIQHALAIPGIALAALNAEQEGANAIVIESMGDTGLIPAREVVKIPVIGLSDSSIRVAQMLGRKFGVITAGVWHGYALERVMKSYGLENQYVGFSPLGLQPFFIDSPSRSAFEEKILNAAIELIQKDADTLIMGGSYFLGKSKALGELLFKAGYPDIVIIDPLPLAIHYAQMMVHAELSHSKVIYANPQQATPVLGYPLVEVTPGVKDGYQC